MGDFFRIVRNTAQSGVIKLPDTAFHAFTSLSFVSIFLALTIDQWAQAGSCCCRHSKYETNARRQMQFE